MDVWLREEDCKQILDLQIGKFNQHCVNVALWTNLKKDDAQHNGLFQMLPDTWVF